MCKLNAVTVVYLKYLLNTYYFIKSNNSKYNNSKIKICFVKL